MDVRPEIRLSEKANRASNGYKTLFYILLILGIIGLILSFALIGVTYLMSLAYILPEAIVLILVAFWALYMSDIYYCISDLSDKVVILCKKISQNEQKEETTNNALQYKKSYYENAQKNKQSGSANLTNDANGNKSLVLDNIKIIGREVFSNKNYTEVVIKEGCEEINYRAFYKNVLLRSATLPKSLKLLGSQVFAGCEKLRTLNFEGSIGEFKKLLNENKEFLTGSSIEYVKCENVEYQIFDLLD